GVERGAAGREGRTLPGDRRRKDLVSHVATVSTRSGAARTRRSTSTSGIPTSTDEATFPTSCPSKKCSPDEPNAIVRKTRLSSGAPTPAEATTRTGSGTRPRSGAPTRLSTVSETANATRLAPTIRQVEPTAASKPWPGNAGFEWT